MEESKLACLTSFIHYNKPNCIPNYSWGSSICRGYLNIFVIKFFEIYEPKNVDSGCLPPPYIKNSGITGLILDTSTNLLILTVKCLIGHRLSDGEDNFLIQQDSDTDWSILTDGFCESKFYFRENRDNRRVHK